MDLPSTDWKKFPIEDLPDCVLFNLLSFLSYDQVATLRPVSVRFEAIGRKHLNSGFHRAESLITKKLQETESQMPKRLSLKNRHPLNNQFNIIRRLYFFKNNVSRKLERTGYTEEHYCFFFGKMIDEILKVLDKAEQNKLGNSYWLEHIEEMQDLAEMASSHLKVVMTPIMKKPETSLLGRSMEEQSSQTVTQVLLQKAICPVFDILGKFIDCCVQRLFDFLWRLKFRVKCIALTSYSSVLTSGSSANWAIAQKDENQVQGPNLVMLMGLVEQQNRAIEEQKKLIEAVLKEQAMILQRMAEQID